jgi:inorganic pyrophosphatase/exopolyphosphatase
MKSEFFYSKSAKLYISLKPLKINSRTKKASEKHSIEMSWDDEGRINYIDFDNSIKLLNSLGARMMTPIEYWLILKDAYEEKNEDMIDSLQSREFCEWLNRVYLSEGTYIDKPKVISEFEYEGKKMNSEYPYGRPGWFNPECNICYKKGLPIDIELFREKFETSWKYWSPDFTVTKLDALAPIRGYVTSVGKPSFDLGIPVDSKQPVQMVRECRKLPLEPIIDEKVLREVDELLEVYHSIVENLKDRGKYEELEAIKKETKIFVEEYGGLFQSSKELAVYDRREQLFNMLGLLKLITTDDYSKPLGKLTAQLSRQLKLREFEVFISSSSKRLKKALSESKDIVFVMGHQNPDADTVVSSLFEAWRNQLLDKEAEYLPMVQSEKLPEEVRRLLGDKISNQIMLRSNKLYEKAKRTGLPRWISVDQNKDCNVQKYFISIIDHHVISDIASKQDIPKTLEMCGSCTSLIVNKYLGMGLSFDKELAKILYGATLLDTENRVEHKMTVKDSLTMDYLKEISEIEEDNDFYGYLMSFLLNTDDPEILFKRDYKEDWGFGFAVAKVKGCFDDNEELLKRDLVDKALNLAQQNNIEKNLPLTVFRLTDYLKDCITVNRERVYLVFNSTASKEFINSAYSLLRKIVEFEFEGSNIKREGDEYIEFWGTGMQLSRKRTAPQLEPLVKAYNQYFYSPAIKKWVKRGFLKNTNYVVDAARNIQVNLSKDLEGRINYITYLESKVLLRELGYSMLSLKEYWKVLNDAKDIKDEQMVSSLQGSNFVEFLDTLIFDSKIKIDHPTIKGEDKFKGDKEEIKVPKGKPGLIHPNDINLKDGFPEVVRSPNEYGNPELWRYWEPDADIVNPVRSYIFLLKQPCLDCKMHPRDSFPNLGIRPVTEIVEQPEVNIWIEDKQLCMDIISEGDVVEYRWRS